MWAGNLILLAFALLSSAASAADVPDALPPQLMTAAAAAPPMRIPDASHLYAAVDNYTRTMVNQLQDKAAQCIDDPWNDWDMAFNYTAHGSSASLEFLGVCMKKYEDAPSRMCFQSEIEFYFESLFNQSKSGNSSSDFSMALNKNCNMSTWVPGCEPGCACGINPDDSNVKNLPTDELPSRTTKCQPCCDGFFCPRGLTCMLPCPLGAYCRSATYDHSSGLCSPYNYQVPLPAERNHSCGGANIWGMIQNTREIFCPQGSYCPTTVEKNKCRSGHYCRVGSTDQTRCSKLITCKESSATQKIHLYGIMLIVALIAILLVIYNCSDHILSTRERRRAKSREKAARSVRESGHARNRWKTATDAAKKHANRLHASLSQRFSNRNDVEEFRMLDAVDSTSSESSSFEVESVNGKSSTRKTAPNVTGETQIFKNVYAQIEKEKSRQQQNDKVNFARVISIATSSQVNKRPPIEVAFKDLTLTLKGKKRCLLKCLTGRIMPGRIAAVMGPSGAGKTTLLTTLAGKATGCKRSGLILINGADVPVQSYRKIVGFVPQDDIVHGNLTVEENLWFSARCRLSADLRKTDKILILERVIENLGLQDIRDSLVGTVEKRGISGGQRKRVNVGLELVMEPSLLFLDEPTSGLDSSSSRLLLQALRQEAHAGVNISMVVHQPSYALFRMFDDLILLAKGGLMCYQGPVSRMEEYFEGIGIKVPDRINPPDYYIDILEGMVEASGNSSLNYRQLPTIWMLQNGYPVPEDMKSTADGLDVSVHNARDSFHEQSFAGELWEDLNSNVQMRHEHVYHNLFQSKDFSNRRTPNFYFQYKYFLGRLSKQRLREASLQATDYGILLVAGACLGVITTIDDTDFGGGTYTFTIIAVALLCQVASLRTFSLDKMQYWRESASGISSLAHFLAKDTLDHFNTVLKPVVYLSMFYFFTNPRSSLADNYIILISLVYCVTGMGYAFSIFFNPGPAQLFSVLVPVCMTLVAGRSIKNNSGTMLRFLGKLCYPKWTLEAFVIANAKRYYGVWLIQRCGVLMNTGFSLHDWKLCILIVVLFGVMSRLVAFGGMIALQKK